MPTTGGLVNRSSTVVTGGTAVTIAANSGRRYLFIQNIDASEDLWIRPDGSAAVAGAAGSILLKMDGGSFVAEGNNAPTGVISLVAATSGHKFTAYEG